MAAPQLTVAIQGQGSTSADQLNTYIQSCDNQAQLANFVGIAGVQVFSRGTSTPNDGGQAMWWWNPNNTAPTDNVNVIVPVGAASGGWNRLFDSLASVSNANLAPMAANTVKMNNTGASANPQDVSTANLWANAALATMAANTVKMNNTGSPATPQDVSTTGLWANSELASMPAHTVKANTTGGSAAPQDIDIATFLGGGGGTGVTLTGSFTSNGYATLTVNGTVITIQWGQTASITNGGTGTTNFPLTFPTACFSVVAQQVTAGTADGTWAVTSFTTAHFTISNGTNMASTYYWIAVGQ